MTAAPDPATPRVAVVGRRHGVPHRRTCDSVRSALDVTRDADEDGTWLVEVIEVDGTVVMERGEILERLWSGNFAGLPEPATPDPADAGALLGALIHAAAPLAPHLEPAVSAVLAAGPSPDEARFVLAGLTEVRDLIEGQIGRVAAYLAAKDEPPVATTGGAS